MTLLAAAEPFNWNNLILVILAVLAAYERWQSQKRSAILKDVSNKVEIIHKETNSMKDALVASTDKAARAEGKQEERNEERIRQGMKPAEVVVVNSPEEPLPVEQVKKKP